MRGRAYVHFPMASEPISLKWVDGAAPSITPNGAAFGIPWPQGEIDKTTPIAVNAGNTSIPVQTWPMAFWPDGSLKWTGHALPADSGLSDSLSLAPGTPAEPQNPVSVSQSDGVITVTTGDFQAQINTSGTTLVSSLSLAGSVKAQNGVLVLHLQDAPDEPELTGDKPSVIGMQGRVDTVDVEQSGPVRVVLKVTGKYTGSGHDDFLPFTARLYISAGGTSIRVVHFFIYDGDQSKDFIKGIGLSFTTPLSDELYNRHVRFVSSSGGIWGEPVRVVSGLRRDATAPVLNAQFNGTATPDISTWPTSVSSEIDQLAVWSDFTLDQLSTSQFTIAKRTNAGRAASFIPHAGFGNRAAGVGYVGGANGGGVVFALKDFWQGFPRGLDIRGAAGDDATVTLWAYSPRGPASDMRHYDTVPHGLDLAYEDVGDPDPNPIGIGRSYEVTINVVPATPARDALANFAATHIQIPQIVANPEFYVSRKVFGGRWNLPDTSTSDSTAIEQKKTELLDFYVKEVDQRNFYGFWNYGDVMHTYDQTRHTWRYDVGGFAWDNGELGTDLWLWMSFMRTGRADVFHMVSALTRHLSEVDFHHTGPFAGLGSRHNVSHWGDGAKEARVSASSIKRPFFYLTTDELVGDIMDYSLQAGETIMTWDPLRKVFPPPPPQGPGRLRIGPDWVTLVGNWFTKWERTNDDQWLQKIKIGMSDIGGFEFGLFTGNGAAVGWNAATSHLVDEGGEGEGAYDLMMVFGGGELLIEAMDIITDEPEFDAAWLDFCRLYTAPDADKITRYGKTWNSGGFNQWYAKLAAYAGERLNDPSLIARAANIIQTNTVGVFPAPTQVGGQDVVEPVQEIENLATNDAAGLSLSEYAVLAIAPGLSAPGSAQARRKWVSPSSDWDRSTIAASEKAWEKDEKVSLKERRPKWKKWLCIS
ncbi:hypothetical protein D9758_011646 [Tetrapyrgos nigripes]|uniref:Tat pathway signal sequence domain protein n=1 Tax=Tetrapyrgos nigripes TaxID=182062 RepID=A0A8H5CU19_9AGAR|nr:hypothetical protein D9758_011646 [Tetrapyrgos nigripes]